MNSDRIEQDKKEVTLLLLCGLQKGVRYCVTWSVVARVGRPWGGKTLLAMHVGDVCQRYHMHQPPKWGCHLQLQVPTRCEVRLSSQPLIVWATFRCPRRAFGQQKMQCTSPNRRARMVVVFCRWPRSDIGVKGGTAVLIIHTPTNSVLNMDLQWTWKK
jgi:hypothetical protein